MKILKQYATPAEALYLDYLYETLSLQPHMIFADDFFATLKLNISKPNEQFFISEKQLITLVRQYLNCLQIVVQLKIREAEVNFSFSQEESKETFYQEIMPDLHQHCFILNKSLLKYAGQPHLSVFLSTVNAESKKTDNFVYFTFSEETPLNPLRGPNLEDLPEVIEKPATLMKMEEYYDAYQKSLTPFNSPSREKLTHTLLLDEEKAPISPMTTAFNSYKPPLQALKEAPKSPSRKNLNARKAAALLN